MLLFLDVLYVEEYWLGEMCFQFSFWNIPIVLRFTHWFCPKRESTYTAFILIFNIIWSYTDNSTCTVNVNSQVFTKQLTKENVFISVLTLSGVMVLCFNCTDFRRALIQTRMRNLSVGSPTNSTPLLFKRWGGLMVLYCMLAYYVFLYIHEKVSWIISNALDWRIRNPFTLWGEQ